MKIPRNVDSRTITSHSAKIWGFAAALLAAIPLGFAFVIGTMSLSLLNGGTLGGYGAAAKPGSGWKMDLSMALLFLLVTYVDVRIGHAVYVWQLRRNHR
jgi:hypothetical protein